jgi:hypothetical protein
MAMMEEQMMMEGASMPRGQMMPRNMDDLMPPEAQQMMMQPDDAITSVLLVRLNNMSEDELALLDKIVTPESAAILMKLLPEFRELIDAMASMQEQPEGPEMGALGGL